MISWAYVFNNLIEFFKNPTRLGVLIFLSLLFVALVVFIYCAPMAWVAYSQEKQTDRVVHALEKFQAECGHRVAVAK